MHGVRRLALLLAIAVAGCSDGIGPGGEEGIGLLFSLEVPSAVSAAEISALETSFEQIDSYQVRVEDVETGSVLAAETISVAAGLDQHTLDLALPESSVGLQVLVSVIGFDGAVELYRASALTTVTASTASGVPLVLPIRYTGPGLRGTVTDDAGDGLPDVNVGLYQAANLIASATTEPDGTYLFLDVAAGAYSVEPTPPASLNLCPVGRDVNIQTGEALVADFVASSVPCQIDLLVLSGGDSDYTQVVADMFANTPGVTADTYFFTNQTPGLSSLRRYDVVLLFTEGIFDETVAIGAELAQYVQAGGNLVLGSFYWQGRSDSGLNTPGWSGLEALDPFTSDIDPLSGSGGATYTANDLDDNLVLHPLTQGLTSIVSIAGYSAGVLAKPATTVVASWTDGAPLVGYRVLGAGQRIVAVSLFPGASIPDQVDGDVQLLWENAVTWAGVAGGPTP
jgi:hypothetical protein